MLLESYCHDAQLILAIERHTIGGIGDWGKDVELADYDGNGRLDVAVASYGGNRVCVLLNNGVGGLEAASVYVMSGNPISVAAGDWDGDGRVDLADFYRLADAFGRPATGGLAALDLDGNGAVGLGDFFRFAAAWRP